MSAVTWTFLCLSSTPLTPQLSSPGNSRHMDTFNFTRVNGLCGELLDDELLVLSYIGTAEMIEALLYGVHFMVFCICITLLCHGKRTIRWPIIVPTTVMFAISTADTALTFKISSITILGATDIQRVATRGLEISQGKNILFVVSNFVAELTLLYRCYMVWNRSKYVLAGCSLLVIADTIWGALGMGPSLLTTQPNRFVRIYLWSILAINIVITLITILRILWISNFGRGFLSGIERKQLTAYHTVIAILLESSLVYSLCVLIYLLWKENSPTRLFLIVVCLRVVGIMPTLLFVQIGLRERMRTDTTISQFRVRHGPPSSFDTFSSHSHRSQRDGGLDMFKPVEIDEEVVVVLECHQESKSEVPVAHVT